MALDLRRLRDATDALRQRISFLPSPIAVVPHDRADFDAIGSAYGLSWVLEQLGIDACVVTPSVSASAAHVLDMLKLRPSTGLSGVPVLVVDTHSSRMLPLGISSHDVVLAIDHHDGGDLPAITFPDAASLSQVIAHLALSISESLGTPIPEPILTLLALGIYYDTNGLSAADPAALSVLGTVLDRLGCGVSELRFRYEPQPPVSLRVAMLRSAERQKIYVCGDYIVVVSHVSSYEGMAASFLLSAGADAVFVHAKDRMSLRFSSRLISLGISASDVLEHVVRTVGGSWGGHDAAAGWSGGDAESAARVAAEYTISLIARRAGCSPRRL